MTDPRTVARDYLQYCDNLGITHVPRSQKKQREKSQPPVAEGEPIAASAPAVGGGADGGPPKRVPARLGVIGDRTRDTLEQLQSIRTELGDCKRCGLCEGRAHIVFGVGDPVAQLMFIGEAPGADEDKQGEPFVGRAGQLLNKIIAAMGLAREQVYIANINKCRPPNNRPPTPEEVAACRPFLLQQIAAIQPQVIVCLGSTAVRNLFDDQDIKISQVRGKLREWNGITVMPTYHPAFLLRNPAMKKPVWEDMLLVMDTLGLARPAPPPAPSTN